MMSAVERDAPQCLSALGLRNENGATALRCRTSGADPLPSIARGSLSESLAHGSHPGEAFLCASSEQHQ